MNTIIERSGLSKESLYETFNMGIGLVIAVSNPDKLLQELSAMDEKAMILGKVTSNEGMKF